MVPAKTCGWSEIQSAPAKLCNDALQRALLKYTAEPTLPYRPEYLDCARAVVSRVGIEDSLNTAIVSIPEALLGVATWFDRPSRFAEPVPRQTSSGFPYASIGLTKAMLFNSKGQVRVETEAFTRLETDVKALISQLRAGEDPLVIFSTNGKAELRPIGKDVRAIQAAPLVLVVVWRMYWWSLMEHFRVWSPEKECATGVNPYADWTRLAKYITRSGVADTDTLVGAGDYSSFDQSHEPHVSMAICDAILEKFPPSGDNFIRRQLWKTACGPKIHFAGKVYQLHKGLPSGHPATSVINSLYNCTLFTMSYVSLRSGGTDAEPFGPNVREYAAEFADNVRLAVLGDDNIFSSAIPEFNELTMTGLMARFGAKYTLDVKTVQATQTFRPLKEVTFMGRHFLSEDCKLLPSLRWSSIREMGHYALSENMLCPSWYADVQKSLLSELSLWPSTEWPLSSRVNDVFSPHSGIRCCEEQSVWREFVLAGSTRDKAQDPIVQDVRVEGTFTPHTPRPESFGR